jgi:hypothetical protein
VVLVTVESVLLDDARSTLLRRARNGSELELVFASWAIAEPLLTDGTQAIIDAAAARRGGLRGYTDVAILGFAVARGLESCAHALEDGLDWLAGRHAYPGGVPAGFEEDAIALLGIVLGARAVDRGTMIGDWLNAFLPAVQTRSTERTFEWFLRASAQTMASGGVNPELGGAAAADVRVGLRARGVEVAPVDPDEEMQSILSIRLESPVEPARAALRIAALDWLRRQAPTLLPGRATIEDVCTLLGRTSAGFMKWTWEEKPRTRGGIARQWHIDNEYHVQNLLWTILAPIFPDLRAEDATPQVGQTQPRADLGIPSLRLIIEVKFLYSDGSLPELINQISADAGLYLTADSLYSNVLAFIWDDGRRSEQHGKLVEGLRRVHGIHDVIVVPRPGAMK